MSGKHPMDDPEFRGRRRSPRLSPECWTRSASCRRRSQGAHRGGLAAAWTAAVPAARIRGRRRAPIGAYWHCLAMAAEAARSSPDSLDAVCALAWALDMTHGYGTALQALESLPAAARQTVEARVVAGDLHRYARNFALAATAYGDPRDLDRYYRKSRGAARAGRCRSACGPPAAMTSTLSTPRRSTRCPQRSPRCLTRPNP